jgi:hypothetical protein
MLENSTGAWHHLPNPAGKPATPRRNASLQANMVLAPSDERRECYEAPTALLHHQYGMTCQREAVQLPNPVSLVPNVLDCGDLFRARSSRVSNSFPLPSPQLPSPVPDRRQQLPAQLPDGAIRRAAIHSDHPDRGCVLPSPQLAADIQAPSGSRWGGTCLRGGEHHQEPAPAVIRVVSSDPGTGKAASDMAQMVSPALLFLRLRLFF